MKEIGGYFGLEQSHGNKEYYTDLLALSTGRNALAYLCKAKGIKKVYIPYFLCESVAGVLHRENVDFEYYDVTGELLPRFSGKLCENEYLYVVNYYGRLSTELVLSLKNTYDRIILDNVHAFFTKPVNGIDTIYSCRKFFGVPDGAYLATDKFLENVEKDCSDGRTSHIYGRIADGAAAHYQEFKANDFSFKTLPITLMSDLTHKMLADIDYEFVKERRSENYNFLAGELDKLNALDAVCEEGPYTYPFMTKNGDALRKKLIENKIYVATLWPGLSDGFSQNLANNILPLPCDQRYTGKDLERIVEIIKE